MYLEHLQGPNRLLIGHAQRIPAVFPLMPALDTVLHPLVAKKNPGLVRAGIFFI